MDLSQRVGGTDFIWNSEKAVANQRKHGVRFEDAIAVFDDPLFRLVNASHPNHFRSLGECCRGSFLCSMTL